MGRQIRQEALALTVIAHPGSRPGWDFAGSFELRNAVDGGISGVGPIAILGARPTCAVEDEPGGRLQMVSE